MVQVWYDKGIFLYLMAGICGIGVLFKVILGWYLSRMVRNTEKMQKTRKKWLQKMQQDYQICTKECGRVHNVDIFVDKYVGNRRFLGIMLSTWDKFGGQTALICAGIAVVAAAAGVFYQVDREVVLFTFFVGIWLVIINMVVDNLASLPEKREQAATNLKDYFINRMAVLEPSGEDLRVLGRSPEASDRAVPELALAQVTENELEALLGSKLDTQGSDMAGAEENSAMEMEGEAAEALQQSHTLDALQQGHTLEAEISGEAQRVPTHLYVINNEQESVPKGKTEKAKVKLEKNKVELEKTKSKSDNLVDIKAAGTQKESRKEAAARKKREKATRQAMAKKEMENIQDAKLGEMPEDYEELVKIGKKVALAETEEGLALASAQIAAARQEESMTVAEIPVSGMAVPGGETSEKAAGEPAAEDRYPGSGQLIEDVLREFLV